MARRSWFDDAREAVSGLQVAEALAAEGAVVIDRGGARTAMGPCPCCNRARSSHDPRPPVLVDGGWNCVVCGEEGDGLALAALALTGQRKPSSWAEVRSWLAGHGWCDPPHGSAPRARVVRPVARTPAPAPKPPPRLPRAEVEALWAACRSPALADGAPHDPYRWLLARNFDPLRVAHLDLARTLPTGAPCPPWASWWRKPWWDAGYRFLMPAYDARGALAGLIARWCGVEECPEKGWRKVSPPDGWPKSLNGKGGSPRGLAFANPTGRWLLARGPEARRGEGEPAWNGAVLLVEGHTDLVRAATAADADSIAVLGYVAGSWTPELAGRLPSVARVVVLPDSDPSGKGEEMAEKVVRTLGELDSAPRVVTADALRAHLERSRNG